MQSSTASPQGRSLHRRAPGSCTASSARGLAARTSRTATAAVAPSARRRRLRSLLLVALVAALLRCPPVWAFNTCEEIQRCSECVFDQTDGLMPPPLMCGWCESTQSCMEVNSTVLSFYQPDAEYGDTDGDGELEHTPAEVAAYRARFCPDLRERNFNPVCADMSCVASHTTNNIYICRAPSIVTLVFACVLFVLTCALYVWMRTLRQLPWKYEPFLSDLLAGRYRQPDDSDADDAASHDSAAPRRCLSRQVTPEEVAVTRPILLQGPPATAPNTNPTSSSTTAAAGRQNSGAVVVVVDAPPETRAPPLAHPTAAVLHSGSTTAAAASAAAAAAVVAATGCCPVCKCRHPVHLGPGDVCFWCNVTRFAFVPFSFCLLSAAVVIVLTFAVSLKPWFSDGYFAEVVVLAYAVYGGLAWYVWRHHRRAPLFYFETEAERRANQRVWAATRHRARTSLVASANTSSFQVGAPGNHHNNSSRIGGGGGDASVSEMEMLGDSRQPSLQFARNSGDVRLQLLNDARRNMASTMYLRLALRLRGRCLLTQMPELKRFRAQLESMHGTTTTTTTATTAGSGASATPARALTASPSPATLVTGEIEEKGSTRAVPVISPFAGTAAATANDAFPPRRSPSASASRHATTTSPGSPVGASGSSSTSFPIQSSRLHAQLTSTPSAPTSPAGQQQQQPPQQQPQQQSPASPPPPPGSTNAAGMPLPAAPSLPDDVARQKRGETAQLLSSDFLSPQYRKALKSTLFRDEFITWCAKPQLRGVLMENEWLLLDLVAGLLFGVWMLMLSSVSDTAYAIVRLSGSTAVAACGLFIIIMFALLLMVVVRGCGRLYVLTNERLITVYESFIEPVVTATELSTVKFAALYGYRSIWSREPVLDFSWEIPALERKMPVIKSHKFPGIVHLNEFLYYFRLVAPQMPFHLQRISESTKQDRIEWRLHVVLCLGLFITLPIITVYPHAVPDFLAVFLYGILAVLIFSTLLRGLRAQQMTCAPLNTAAVWAPESEWTEMGELTALTSPPSGGAAGGVAAEGGQPPRTPGLPALDAASAAAAAPLPLPSSFTLNNDISVTQSAGTTSTATPNESASYAASPTDLPGHAFSSGTPVLAAVAAAAGGSTAPMAAAAATAAAAGMALLSAAPTATVVPAASTAGKADCVVHPTVAAPVAAGVHVVCGQGPTTTTAAAAGRSSSTVSATAAGGGGGGAGRHTSPTSAGIPAAAMPEPPAAAAAARSGPRLSSSGGSNPHLPAWGTAMQPTPTSSSSGGRRGPTPPLNGAAPQRPPPPPSSAVRAMEESLTGFGVVSLASSVNLHHHHSYVSPVGSSVSGAGVHAPSSAAAPPPPASAASGAATPPRDARRARRDSLGPSATGFVVFPAATAGSHGGAAGAGGVGGGSQRGRSRSSVASSRATSPSTCASTPTADGPHGYLQLPAARKTTTRGAAAASAGGAGATTTTVPAAWPASEGQSGSATPHSARSVASATRSPTESPMDFKR